LKKHWLVALVALGVGAACDQAPRPGDMGGAEAAAQQPAGEALATNGGATESGVLYVDVRTPEEFAAGHVTGAINIPHSEMAHRYPELEQYGDKDLLLYCRSGRRSGIATRILEDVGFGNVRDVGGLSGLEAQGIPTTR
jgi:phage shock protein E